MNGLKDVISLDGLKNKFGKKWCYLFVFNTNWQQTITARHDPNLELEWRLSFEIAEQILVRAMNHCYALLKIFVKEILNEYP